MKEDLKDCPFCGGVAVFYPDTFVGISLSIVCKRCDASHGDFQYCDFDEIHTRAYNQESQLYNQDLIDKTRNELIKLWNKRI